MMPRNLRQGIVLCPKSPDLQHNPKQRPDTKSAGNARNTPPQIPSFGKGVYGDRERCASVVDSQSLITFGGTRNLVGKISSLVRSLGGGDGFRGHAPPGAPPKLIDPDLGIIAVVPHIAPNHSRNTALVILGLQVVEFKPRTPKRG
jgi:hypothetical protein